MAEQIKIQLGACLPGVYAETMEVHGEFTHRYAAYHRNRYRGSL